MCQIDGNIQSEPRGGYFRAGSLRTQCVHRSLQEPHTPTSRTLLPGLSPPGSTLNFFPVSILHFLCCLVSGQWIGSLATGLLDLHTSPELDFGLRLLSPMAQAGHPSLFWSTEALDQTISLYLRQELEPRLSSCLVEQDVPLPHDPE